jgi:hypothetical protein
MSGDEAVAIYDVALHAEIATAMADKFVDFFERAFVEQEVNALARRQFSLCVLLLPPLLAPAGFGGRMAAAQLFQPVVRHSSSTVAK